MNAAALYDWLVASGESSAAVESVLLGLSWSSAQVEDQLGFAFSPRQVPRTIPWAGTLSGRPAGELVQWLKSWDAAEQVVALAVLNALVNGRSALAAEAMPLEGSAPGHLRVFEHFMPQLAGQQVAIIGRYPGLDKLWPDFTHQCIERMPQDGDLPDTACEFVLPQADWVFITASSIANKSLPRLLELSRQARVVLMGPSLPWLEGWKDFGVDHLCGVQVCDAHAARLVVAEGGGTRLFAGPVRYALQSL